MADNAAIAALRDQEATVRELMRSLDRKITDARTKLADLEQQCAAATTRANDFASAIICLSQES